MVELIEKLRRSFSSARAGLLLLSFSLASLLVLPPLFRAVNMFWVFLMFYAFLCHLAYSCAPHWAAVFLWPLLEADQLEKFRWK